MYIAVVLNYVDSRLIDAQSTGNGLHKFVPVDLRTLYFRPDRAGASLDDQRRVLRHRYGRLVKTGQAVDFLRQFFLRVPGRRFKAVDVLFEREEEPLFCILFTQDVIDLSVIDISEFDRLCIDRLFLIILLTDRQRIGVDHFLHRVFRFFDGHFRDIDSIDHCPGIKMIRKVTPEMNIRDRAERNDCKEKHKTDDDPCFPLLFLRRLFPGIRLICRLFLSLLSRSCCL